MRCQNQYFLHEVVSMQARTVCALFVTFDVVFYVEKC
jgi:hypothetical protein